MEAQSSGVGVRGRAQPPRAAPTGSVPAAVRRLLAGPCRIAVVGMNVDPMSVEFVRAERLLTWDFQLFPVHSRCGDLLGHACYERLADVPGPIDVLLVLPGSPLSQRELAVEAIDKDVELFWVEDAALDLAAAAALAARGIAAVGGRSLQVEVALQR